jgi:hypothetical protein
MATYIQGVTDYIPDYQPFQPDLNFYASYLQTKQNQYDRVIIDMQLPTIAGRGIDQEGGISILLYLSTTINENTKRVINSSSDETRHVLDKHNFKNEVLIINNSGRNNTLEFSEFLKQ